MSEQSYDGHRNALPERFEIRVLPECRRRWSSAAKLAIVRETLVAGSTAQLVADRHGADLHVARADAARGDGGLCRRRDQAGRRGRLAAPEPGIGGGRTVIVITVAIGGSRVIKPHAQLDRGRAAVRGAAALRVRRGRRAVQRILAALATP